jgi:threonine synthase
MLLERYREFLPVTDKTPRLTLGEGNTPLIAAPRLASAIGVRELFLKFEGMNPTGSFKDRGMVMAVAKAVELGAESIICASTGNTSASAAAYAARAGIEAIVVVPSGKIALGKLAQALMYGARLLVIDGNFDQALRIVFELSDRFPVTLVNSVNQDRIEGQTTAAYEICDALGDAPDALCLPETVATAIRIGNPASWQYAVAARDESEGLIDAVTDEQILAAWRDLASIEGVFCEPASASGVAGLRMLVEQGRADRDGRYVAVLTGHGLKDPGLAVEQFEAPTPVPAEMGAIVRWLGF